MSKLEPLKGKTILIGKEPKQGRLLIAVVGIANTGAIGAFGSVSNGVSRCIPTDGIAHCKITVGMDESMTITNMKPQNVTYVDGIEIVSKRITTSSQVALGMDRYLINVNTVIEAALKLLPPKVEEYSIKHLEKVWDKYHDSNIELKKKNQEMAAAMSFPPILTLGSTGISAVAGVLGFMQVTFITIPLIFVGAGLMIRNYYRRKNDTSIEDGDKLAEEFQLNYVCPNPKCKRFMGNQPYKIIRQQKGCPLCKCLYNEK